MGSHTIAILTPLVPHTPHIPRISALRLVVCDFISGHVLDLKEDVEIVLWSLSELWLSGGIVGDYCDSADVFDAELSLVSCDHVGYRGSYWRPF